MMSSRLSEPEKPKHSSWAVKEKLSPVERRQEDIPNTSKALGYLQKEEEINSRTDFTINILKKRLAEAKKETERARDEQLQIQVSQEYELSNMQARGNVVSKHLSSPFIS